MAIKSDREYRAFNLLVEERSAEEGEEAPKEKDFKVKGYASTFERYELYNDGETVVYEQFSPDAFDEADMSDVVFLYNHEGMVYARQKNGTLKLSVDNHGLLSEADLGMTTQSRELFEAIESGLIDQMSFAFVVDVDEYDQQTRTRTIKKVRKVYDVSAVSIPANPTTDIATVSARDYFHGVMEAEKAERLENERRLAVAKAKYVYGGI